VLLSGSRLTSFLFAVTLVFGISVLDRVTGYELSLSILYLAAIAYAAMSTGRTAFICCSIISVVPLYVEQAALANSSGWTASLALLNTAVRLFVYLFAGEVVLRLVESRRQAKALADELTQVNDHLRRAYSVLDKDVSAAGLLQASVLAAPRQPTRRVDIGICTMYAGPLGGDFADRGIVHDIVYACVADVAGRGTQAALFTTLLKYLLRDALQRGLRTATIADSLDESLRRILPENKFVTTFYVEVDSATGRAEYLNAGHPEGMLYRMATSQVELLTPTGPLLGCSYSVTGWNSANVQMGPGDVLVIYTDGATDSRDLNGDLLGQECIRQLTEDHAHLGAQEMADAIVSGILARTIPERRDDISVVCIKMVQNPDIEDPK